MIRRGCPTIRVIQSLSLFFNDLGYLFVSNFIICCIEFFWRLVHVTGPIGADHPYLIQILGAYI